MNEPEPTEDPELRKEQSKPVFQFRGVWLPAELFEKLRTGDITPTDLVVYCMIEAYTYKGSKGCFASNEYLARAAGVQPQQASRIISKLVDLKLVRRVGNVQNRKLWAIRGQGSDSDSIPVEDRGSILPSAEGHRLYPSQGYSSIPPRANITQTSELKTENTAAPQSGSGGMNEPLDWDNPDNEGVEPLQPPAKSPTACGNGQKSDKGGSAPAAQTKHKEAPVNAISRPSTTDLLSPPIKGGLPPPTEAQKATRKLHAAIVQRYISDTPFSESAWVAEFEKLARASGDNWELINLGVDWYCKNIGALYVPKIRGAAEFRLKFQKVQDGLEKAGLLKNKADPTERPPHPETQGIVDDIEGLGWPKGSEKHLPRAVSESLHNLDAVRAALDSTPLSKPAKRFYDDADSSMGPSSHEIEIWFRKIHKRVVAWKGFNGKLDWAIWTLTHDDAYPRLCELSQECPEEATWQEILKAAKG